MERRQPARIPLRRDRANSATASSSKRQGQGRNVVLGLAKAAVGWGKLLQYATVIRKALQG